MAKKTVVRQMYEDTMYHGNPNTWDFYLAREKEQIIEAFLEGKFNGGSRYDTASRDYYEKNYATEKTKDSVEKIKEYKDWLNEIPELSDEEIDKITEETYGRCPKDAYYDSITFAEGMKAYREQLKSKQ